MHRTQIYLPEEDYQELVRLGDLSGRSLAELVRSAVRDFLSEQSAASRNEVLEETFGLWGDRETGLAELRRGWARREARFASPD